MNDFSKDEIEIKKELETPKSLNSFEGLMMAIFYPFIMLLSLLIVQEVVPGFWNSLVVVFTSTLICALVANRSGAQRRIDNVDGGAEYFWLRNMMLALVFALMSLSLTYYYNTDWNEISSVGCLASISLMAILLVASSIKKIFPMMKENSSGLFIGYFHIISMVTILILIFSFYGNFGTQYIWVSVLTIIYFTLIWFGSMDDPAVYYNPMNLQVAGEFVGPQIVISSILIGVISTLYQFWFATIFTIVFWKILAYIVGATLLVLGVRFFIKFLNHKSEIVKEEQAQQAQKVAKLRKNEATLEQVKNLGKKINSGEASWVEILEVYRYNDKHLEVLQPILPIIFQVKLETLIEEISDIRQKLVWNGDNLDSALELLNSYAQSVYKDNTLKNLIEQVDTFQRYLDPYKEYAGYDFIQFRLKKLYPEYFSLKNKTKEL